MYVRDGGDVIRGRVYLLEGCGDVGIVSPADEVDGAVGGCVQGLRVVQDGYVLQECEGASVQNRDRGSVCPGCVVTEGVGHIELSSGAGDAFGIRSHLYFPDGICRGVHFRGISFEQSDINFSSLRTETARGPFLELPEDVPFQVAYEDYCGIGDCYVHFGAVDDDVVRHVSELFSVSGGDYIGRDGSGGGIV